MIACYIALIMSDEAPRMQPSAVEPCPDVTRCLVSSSLCPQESVSAAVAQGTINSDAFAQWRDVMATAVAAEKATRVFPVSE